MKPFSDKKIIDSWMKNSVPWVKAIDRNQIESRTLVTNKAIIDCVVSLKPKTVLDLGCGEGWLSRALNNQAIETLGIDVVDALITRAKQHDIGKYQVMSYEQVAKDELTETFDVVVSNFSLLGKESVENIFKIMPTLVNLKGYFVIQTIHPLQCENSIDYNDGWQKGSWQGFGDEFVDPAPWYFRTIESWIKLFNDNNFRIEGLFEPKIPGTGQLASIIFVGRKFAD